MNRAIWSMISRHQAIQNVNFPTLFRMQREVNTAFYIFVIDWILKSNLGVISIPYWSYQNEKTFIHKYNTMATTDLPWNVDAGEPMYNLEEPLEMLQTMLNQKNIDIESMDMRGAAHEDFEFGEEPRQLKLITQFTSQNPEMDIRSARVRDLNDKFDFEMDSSDPNWIFRDDLVTRSSVATIQRGNQSFAQARDQLITPPPIDTQQKIFELLQAK